MPLPLYGSGGRMARMVAADLTDGLFVDAAHEHDLGLRRLELDAFWRVDDHRMAEAHLQLQALALDAGSIAHADDLQTPLEAFGDTFDHVGDESPREPVQGAVRTAVGGPSDRDHAALQLHDHLPRHPLHKLTLRALDGHQSVVVGELDLGWVPLLVFFRSSTCVSLTR